MARRRAGAEGGVAVPRPSARVRLLGPIEVQIGSTVLGARSFSGTKPKQLLELLVLARGRPVTKDRLVEELWGDAPPQRATATLESYVSLLRRRLAGAPLVETARGAYRFAVERAELDLDRFDDLLARAAHGAAAARRQHLERALELVRGELAEDEPDARWVEPHRRTYHARVLAARCDAARAALAAGEVVAAYVHAEAALSADPLSETAYRLAMVAAYGAGHGDRALEIFERCRKALAGGLGVEPMAATAAVASDVCGGRPAAELVGAHAGASLEACGPLPRALPFVGRQREVASVREAVTQALRGAYALVLVDGERGIGKTRLVEEVLGRLDGVAIRRVSCAGVAQWPPFGALTTALPPGAPGFAELARPREADAVDGLGTLRALETVADTVSKIAPAVLVLDDLEHADAESVRAVSYLARRCATLPLAVLVTCDGARVAPGHPVHALEPQLVVRLGPLAPEAVDAAGVPELFPRTGGHPLLLAACVAAARSHGADGRLHRRLDVWIRESAAAAGPDAHAVLVAAAAAPDGSAPEEVADALGRDVASVTEDLDRLCHQGLLRLDGAGYAMRYPLLREVLTAPPV